MVVDRTAVDAPIFRYYDSLENMNMQYGQSTARKLVQFLNLDFGESGFAYQH